MAFQNLYLISSYQLSLNLAIIKIYKNIKLCTKNGYYFYKNNAYGVIIILYDVYDKQKDSEELLNYYPTDKSKEVRGISLIIAYNNSQCLYEIYKNKKLNKNYLKPISCSSTCKAYGRQ